MPTTIEVNKQSVQSLLSEGAESPFVIPEYQRPYEWSYDQIDVLFQDLWNFACTEGGINRDGTFFLGCIVSYTNTVGEQEIIDGQQRITSLFLLLRAIYTKLKQGEQTDAAKNFIKQIEPVVWRADKLSGTIDYGDILLDSRVVDTEANEILRHILETGEASEDAEDNYSRNYLRLLSHYEKACADNPMLIYDFIYALLKQAILLPIKADTQDTALTIFSTLNDRGLPLSEADIFKAKIYSHLDNSEKSGFIDKWKELDQRAREAGESIQQLFYYYMFYLRARDDDDKTTTPGLRKYYIGNNDNIRLFEPNLIDDLFAILCFWEVVNQGMLLEDQPWSQNSDILSTLDTLKSFSNEFWKYPVINYYLVHKGNPSFEEDFRLFLHKLLTELLSRFLVKPTVNAIKPNVMKLDVAIMSSPRPSFDFPEIEIGDLERALCNPSNRIISMILKLLAYQDPQQTKLLPAKWEVEHILPQKWKDSYFPDTDDSYVKERIEHIGNKVPFEKKLNIIASNGYFGKKREQYEKSDIAIARALAAKHNEDWTLDDIVKRDAELISQIIALFARWRAEYDNGSVEETVTLTDEEREMIAKLKELGIDSLAELS